MREKIDTILNNGIYGWRKENQLIKGEILDQILSVISEETDMEMYKVVIRKVVDLLKEKDKHNRFGFEDGTILIYKEDWWVMLQEWGIKEDLK